eukprot:c19419_g1_i1 orf=586-1134(-)
MGTTGVSSSSPMAAFQASSSLFCPSSPAGMLADCSLPVKQALWSKVPNSNLLSTKNKSIFSGRQGTQQKHRFHVHAEFNERKSGGGDFLAGFVLGGVVCGALGYLFAPQVNKLISAVERELDEPSKQLPKVLDDDEGLETRRSLNEKIAQLNAAIDDVSAQLRADDQSGGQAGGTAELESAA